MREEIKKNLLTTICPRTLDPFYTAKLFHKMGQGFLDIQYSHADFTKWVKTSWRYSTPMKTIYAGYTLLYELKAKPLCS